MRIAIGMDLHKDTAVCFAVFAGNGEPNEKQRRYLDGFNSRHRTQGSEPEDMKAIVDDLRDQDVHVLIENSTKTFDTYWVLTFLGCHVTVAQARDLYRITKSDKKTDMNDSMELANYMRRRLHGENEFAECVMPTKDWMIKREICRTIFKEKLHLADLKRRTRSHLLLHGIRLSREYSDIFSKRALIEMRATDDVCLRIFAAEAADIKKRTDLEARTIELLFDDIPMFHLIRSIPGFGLVSSAYLTSMIMDIGRFSTCNEFTASFGVVPRQRSSADSNPNCHITHRGDAEARRLLTQATFVHINNVQDSVVTKMYNRLKKNGKAHKEALTACSRKMLTVVWSVLRSGLPYTDDAGLLARASAAADSGMEDMVSE